MQKTLILIRVTSIAVTIMSMRPLRLSAKMMRIRLMIICNSNCTWIDQFSTVKVSLIAICVIQEAKGTHILTCRSKSSA